MKKIHRLSGASPASRQTGFSLVELLVGLAIGMIGMIVIYHVLSVTTGYRRTTTDLGMAQESGAAALHYIERDLRRAGYGLHGMLWQSGISDFKTSGPTMIARARACEVKARDNDGGGRDFTFSLAPVQLTSGGKDANDSDRPDTLTLLFGNAPAHAYAPALTSNATASTMQLRAETGFGFQDKALVVVADLSDKTYAANSSKPVCEMTQLTGSTPQGTAGCPPDARNPWCVNIRNSPSTDYPFGRALSAAYPGKVPTSPRDTALLFNLGTAPRNPTYQITGLTTVKPALSVTDNLFPTAGGVISDNIVNLQVQLAFDDGTFGDTFPSGKTWANVNSLRVAVVARSSLLEKGNDKGDGSGTTDPVTPETLVIFPSTDPTKVVKMKLSADERNYRYKTYYTVVPMRTVIWNS